MKANKITFEVNIDFDEASASWMQNKRAIGNGMYKYCCTAKTKLGEKCKNKPYGDTLFCRIHKKTSHAETRII